MNASTLDKLESLVNVLKLLNTKLGALVVLSEGFVTNNLEKLDERGSVRKVFAEVLDDDFALLEFGVYPLCEGWGLDGEKVN